MQQAQAERVTDPRRAIQAFQELLADLSDHPRTHPLVIGCRNLLALTLRDAGEEALASVQLQDLTLELLRNFGAGHPQVIDALNNLLDVARSDPEAMDNALEMCAQVVDAARETLGTRSPQFRSLLRWASTVTLGEEGVESLPWRRKGVRDDECPG